MKKLFLLSLLLFVIILSGCKINLNIFNNENEETENNSNSSVDDIISNIVSNYPTPLEGTYVIAEDNSLTSSPNWDNELSDSSITFHSDNTFIAYLGFGNTIDGTYTIKDDTITCKATSFTNEYSPIQNISVNFSFQKISDAILKVNSADSSYRVKTTNMNDDGEWVYDGDTKDMPLTSFTKDTIYTLWEPLYQ